MLMLGPRSQFGLLIFALWSVVLVLAFLTYIAVTASVARSDCAVFQVLTPESYSNVTLNGSAACTFANSLSRTVYNHSSYFQSTHIIIIRLIGTLSLLALRPSLTAMIWSALQTFTATNRAPTLRFGAFQTGVGLAASPALIPAALYAKESCTLPFKVVFVLIVSILSLLSPLAVSPIYRPHAGPHAANVTLDVGAGVGPDCPADYEAGATIPQGISAGRTLLGAQILMGIAVAPNTFNAHIAPFFSMDAITEIWYAEVDMVIARNSLDCSASAPARLNSTAPIVILDTAKYFMPDGAVGGSTPNISGLELGYLTNDPQVSAVYLGSNSTTGPGWVTGETSVIFIAANGTLEGAQQTIKSPEATSRIMAVDVLVCTSTTTLETTHCIINQGNLTSCAAFLPAGASTSSTGGVEAFIYNPVNVAMWLAASPVTAYYTLPSRLPTYLIDNTIVAAKIPPLPDLTSNLAAEGYSVPLSYITDVLFAQSAQALVQGMAQWWPVPVTQTVALNAVFATSRPVLSYIVLALSAACALTATIVGTAAFRYDHSPLDVTRLLAISRSDELDHVFVRYSDINVPVDAEILERKVGYDWVEGLRRRVLVVDLSPETLPLAYMEKTNSE
ncbi:hypothetical protein HWV62_9421 [Athelia sp. TMB]|nr:hypothetical protein HWV62_9421 [Athelia sp. TMB]